MTQEHYKVDSNSMYYLVFAVKTEYSAKGEPFPYDNLFSQVETYQMNGTPFDPAIHNIDDFMVSAYGLYDRYLNAEDKIAEVIDKLGFSKNFGIDGDLIKKEFNNLIVTFDGIIENCNFESVEIKGIQINLLKDKLKIAIEDENYELAAILRDKLRE
jgi:hypothetical protein